MTHPPMDFLTFTVLADAVAKDNPDWRRGQSYFNALHQVRPELAEEIRGRQQDLDPFHRDAQSAQTSILTRGRPPVVRS